METKFVEKMLKKDLVALGQNLEKELLDLQEKNEALVSSYKVLHEELKVEKGRTTALRDKNDSQQKEISDLNIKIRSLEDKSINLTNDWASDSLAAEKRLDILTAELKAANGVADNRAISINALKAENTNLEKANKRNKYINLFLGGIAFLFFVYICWRM